MDSAKSKYLVVVLRGSCRLKQADFQVIIPSSAVMWRAASGMMRAAKCAFHTQIVSVLRAFLGEFRVRS